MSVIGFFRTDSRATNAVRTGGLALGGALVVFVTLSVLDTGVFRETRTLELTWTDGHADSPAFCIGWPGEYSLSLGLADSSVPTRERSRVFLGGRWTQRCGNPFPAGLTWSVRHGGRIVDQQRVQGDPWCGDPSQRELRSGIGSFRARPGSGYSIRVEPVGHASTLNSSRLPLHADVWLQEGSRWDDKFPAVLIGGSLLLFGLASVSLGWAQQIREHHERRS